jgi:hypothetical protein
VLAKNQVLMEGEIMWPAFVKHGNGRDWWIMGMQRADTKHYLYLLSPQGLTGPYIQDIGPPFVLTEYESESLFSENGELFLRHDSKTALRLYDFDRCSGELSNLRIVPFQEPLHSFYAAFFCAERIFAQSHHPDEWWPWGINEYPGTPGYGNAWLRFEDGVRSVQPADLNMNFEAAVAVAADTLGNLLFYSNGCEIHGADDQLLV